MRKLMMEAWFAAIASGTCRLDGGVASARRDIHPELQVEAAGARRWAHVIPAP